MGALSRIIERDWVPGMKFGRPIRRSDGVVGSQEQLRSCLNSEFRNNWTPRRIRQRLSSANYADELRSLVATLEEAKREINLAREQSTKSKHLYIRARRAAVQAARAVTAAVDLGFSELWPGGWWVLSAMRNPDDPDRPPATIQVGEWKAQLRSVKLGSGCNPDGTLRDDTAFAVWVQQICPAMRSRQTTSKADAGSFDIPAVKVDDEGQILGRDGKPISVVEYIDSETGERGQRRGPDEVRITDDHDEADALEHIRCQAADWVDACSVAVELIRKEVTADEAKSTPSSPSALASFTSGQRRLPSLAR